MQTPRSNCCRFIFFIYPWDLSAALLPAGNCGKAFQVRRSKKSQSKEDLRRSRDDLSEESRSLLDSEDELDREEVLNPEPENRSVSAPMRPEPTEYDRLMTNAPTQMTTAPPKHGCYVSHHLLVMSKRSWSNETLDACFEIAQSF